VLPRRSSAEYLGDMSPGDQGSGGTHGTRHTRRPTRAAVLAARRERRIRVALYTFSLSWPFLVALALGHWPPSDGAIPTWRVAIYMSPAVIAGVVAGRRIWPAYFFAVLVVVAPVTLFHWDPLIAILLVSTAVLFLGYVGQALYCVATGRRWRDLSPREADAPRGVGGASTASGGVGWKRSATVQDSAPTGEELPQRRIF
jgi:hypothetical protein